MLGFNKASYISTIRDSNNKIVKYVIKDGNSVKEIQVETLKEAIQQEKLIVKGLEINSKGDLISLEDKYKRNITKFKLFGLATVIPTYCGEKCYLIKEADQAYTIYIPPNITSLNNKNEHPRIKRDIKSYRRTRANRYKRNVL